MKNYILMQYFIQNILNGANYYNGVINVKFSNEEIINANANSLIKCVASYFNLDNFYPEVKDLKLDKALYDSLKNDFDLYKKDNVVNAELDNNLKEYLNTLDSKKIHLELKKYYQNRLTNIEVIKYIKKLIDDQDLYNYDRYLNYTKEQCEKGIKTLTEIFNILDKVEFEINDLGIKEKSITFEVGSYEYENISPCLNFDEYDISFYKRVLNLLKKKLERL
ncbi:MAG: hypothetical protein SO484_01055 [Bacilli bacterium]|nr:hypothetical protein [Bacilli bacterium]MDY4618580.1 hypothetical protein [Bacilli bacterium]